MFTIFDVLWVRVVHCLDVNKSTKIVSSWYQMAKSLLSFGYLEFQCKEENLSDFIYSFVFWKLTKVNLERVYDDRTVFFGWTIPSKCTSDQQTSTLKTCTLYFPSSHCSEHELLTKSGSGFCWPLSATAHYILQCPTSLLTSYCTGDDVSNDRSSVWNGKLSYCILHSML